MVNVVTISFKTKTQYIVISGFRRDFEICALLEYYTESCGNSLPTFRDNVSVPSLPLNMGPISCSETSVKDYNSTLRNTPEERRSDSACVCVFRIVLTRSSDIIRA